MDHRHEELLADIGRDYYLAGRSKVEIATSYGISRFQVARLLEEAREVGIVDIQIHVPVPANTLSTADLEQQLGLSKLVIAPGDPDPARTLDALAKAAAGALMDQARTGSTIGISWSRTLDAAARHVHRLPKLEIVQLAGALPVAGSGNSLQLLQRLAQVSGSTIWPIWAPLVVDDAATAAGLRRQPEIASALAKADQLDLAVVAIGAWAPQASTVWDRVDNKDRQEGSAAGAVAECSGRLFDAAGQAVHTDLDDRVVAVTIEQLRGTPEVIAVARGASAAGAARAAAASGIITILITDEALAAALSAPDASPPGSPAVGGEALRTGTKDHGPT